MDLAVAFFQGNALSHQLIAVLMEESVAPDCWFIDGPLLQDLDDCIKELFIFQKVVNVTKSEVLLSVDEVF